MYLCQRPEAVTCGPVSVLNAYYYLHGKTPGFGTRELYKRMNTSEEYGTDPWAMHENGIIKLGKEVWDMEKIIQMNSFIILYPTDELESHYVFVSQKDGLYWIWNFYCEVENVFTHVVMDEEDFINTFFHLPPEWKRQEDGDYPMALELTPLKSY